MLDQARVTAMSAAAMARLVVFTCLGWLAAFPSVIVAQMTLTSPAFPNFGTIPSLYGCDIETRDTYRPSIPLSWTRAPAKVQSFFLLVDDMDANAHVLWAVKDIPSDTTAIPADASETNMPVGCVELPNSEGADYYSGPCPMNTEHHYRFRLYALSRTSIDISLKGDPRQLKADDYVAQIEDDVLYVAVLVGKFYKGLLHLPPRNDTTRPNYRRIDWSRTVSSAKNVTDHRQNETRDTIRPWHENESAVLQRYVKPSEVLRSPRVSKDWSKKKEPCGDERGRLLAGSMETQQLQQTEAQQTAELDNLTTRWCQKANGHSHAGIRITENGTERCSLKTMVPDASYSSHSLPRQFTCASLGELAEHQPTGLSPSLVWTGLPTGSASLALVMEDATPRLGRPAGSGSVHWLVVNMPPSVSSLVAGASSGNMPPLSVELKNSFNKIGYTAPCPQDGGDSFYRIHLFAMPHSTTRLFLPLHYTSIDAIHRLQRLALCTSTTELSLSSNGAAAWLSENRTLGQRHIAKREDVQSALVPGEIQ